ncbi:uncharacterized protein [Dysidea avara]|uniref:uncharacterized protein isoform X2 n=1 Tax=Dysidea avara TaxID=196820 RepID=UPI003331B412
METKLVDKQRYVWVCKRKVFALYILLLLFIEGDAGYPINVTACISYDATETPLLNAQWEDSGITGTVVSVFIFYSVNGGTEKIIITPYQGSNIITDVALSDVQYGSDISMQVSVRSNSTTSGRSEEIIMRANPLYGVMWSHSESNILTFTCVMACRTSTIRGCAVFLFHNVSHSTHASQSDQLSGNLEEVESRNSTIQFVNVSLSNPITYIAVTIPTDVSPVLGEHLEGTISLDNFISSTSSISSSSTVRVFTIIGGSEMSSSPLLPTISTTMTQQSGPVMAPLGATSTVRSSTMKIPTSMFV